MKNVIFWCEKKIRIIFIWMVQKWKNSITNEGNYLQKALNDSLDYEGMKSDPQGILKPKPYISQCSIKGKLGINAKVTKQEIWNFNPTFLYYFTTVY